MGEEYTCACTTAWLFGVSRLCLPVESQSFLRADIANPVHSSDCESAWSNPSFFCKHGWGKCSSFSGLWPCNMGGCPCRNFVVAKKRFCARNYLWVVTISLLI